MKYILRLETLSPLVFSHSHATGAGHKCLDYIPGSALLGAMASRTYAQLTDSQSWRLFHSGEVKFSNGYKAVTEHGGLLSTFPIPTSWHTYKGVDAHIGGKLVPQNISNFAANDYSAANGKQPEQCRTGYVSAKGDLVSVDMGFSVKTAIDPLTGTVQDGQLFGYQYIESGQVFLCSIDSGEEPLPEVVLNELDGRIRLGRSRSGEFGQVKVQILSSQNPPLQIPKQQQITLWLTSDCQLLDINGMPTVVPEGSVIGQPKLKFNAGKSFLRTHTNTLFNRKRGGFDSHHQLVTRGSVLVFDVLQDKDYQSITQQLSKGIGIGRELGYGDVVVNPTWAESAQLNCNQLFDSVANLYEVLPPIKAATSETSTLIAFVESKLQLRNNENAMLTTTQKIATNIVTFYQLARGFNNILNSNEAGPSANQWRRIFAAVRGNNPERWSEQAFEGNSRICKAENDPLGWGISWIENNNLVTFESVCKKQLENLSYQQMRSLLEVLCEFEICQFSELKKLKNKLNRLSTMTEGEA